MSRTAVLGMLALLCACSSELGSVGPDGGAVDAGAGMDATATHDAGPGLDGSAMDGSGVADCDPGWTLAPASPETGVLVWATYSSAARGYPYIQLEVTGPGTAEVGSATIEGSGPWSWSFPVAITGGGAYTFTFIAEMPPERIASCSVFVRDTGAPPPLPAGGCDGKVCGDDDGSGGLCQRCAMVESEGGTCMDPASPIGPGGAGPWACLDTAGCLEDSGLCRIWCPGEPCDTTRHPDGCPQGVESCLVPPGITDYEEACRTCCESRRHDPTGEYACWDDTYNICRYPGDCGMPYPLP